MRKLSLICLFFFFIYGFFSLSSFFSRNTTHAQEPLLSTDQLLVQYRSNINLENRLKFHRSLNIQQVGNINILDVDILKVEKEKIETVLERLNRDPRVLYAEPDHKAFALELTNDPGIVNNLQWGMFKIKAADVDSSAWNFSKSNPSVNIAILDTGIDQNHEDLSSKIVSNKNCTDSGTVDDLYGHGTHVAGIAAAVTNNGVGIAGVGYNASLMNVKVLDDGGSGYYSWIANCIVWAADNGAKVVNMSLGGGAKSKTLENAVNYAWGKGVVIVAAAGNSGNNSPTYPGYYSNVIAVAATDQNDKKASWSSYSNRWVDVAAPGVSIYSTFPNHPYVINKKPGYDYASGTSMATPHVAGLAALVWSTNFGTNNSSVRNRIESTADKISGTGKYWIYGRINALASLSQSLNSNPAPRIQPLSRF